MFVSAATLSPDAALKRVLNSMRTSRSAEVAEPSQYQLQLTRQTQNGEAAVYVFAPKQGTGFIVASANDEGEALLGWSDTKAFNSNDLPQGLRWWLEARSRHTTAKTASRADELEAVQPICTTTWNQDAPYNDMCPEMKGNRSATGCAATAIAQVLKTYKYPTKGKGSHKYTWEITKDEAAEYAGTYTASADFSTTTYDWANMLDDYATVDYTPTQANAVALLMYHLGVASDMQYSPEESGTSSCALGAGLIRYFDYDASMSIQCREWYTQDEWNELVYSEISQGYPLMYGGQSEGGGHAFVCDGYNNGYFHINWGWGGVSDGYFLLSDLDPDSQGIGGSSSEDGFNDGQEILYGVRPNFGTEATEVCMIILGDIYSDKDEYDAKTDTIVIKGQFGNNTLDDIKFAGGLMLLDENGEFVDVITDGEFNTLEPGDGFENYEIKASELPEGEYYITLAYTIDGKNWESLRHGLDAVYQLKVSNDGETVAIENTTRPSEEEEEPDGSILGYEPATEEEWCFEQGKNYTFYCSVQSDEAFEKDMKIILVDTKEANTVLESETVHMALDPEKSEVAIEEFKVTFSCEPGEYILMWGYPVEDGDDEEEEDFAGLVIQYIKVVAAGDITGISDVRAIDNTPVKIYNLSGVSVKNARAGIYIIKQGAEVKRVIMK